MRIDLDELEAGTSILSSDGVGPVPTAALVRQLRDAALTLDELRAVAERQGKDWTALQLADASQSLHRAIVILAS